MASTITNQPGQNGHSIWRTIAWLAGGLILIFGSAAAALGVLVVSRMTAGEQIGQVFTWLFALDHQQYTWYITRAAGLTAYMLLWLSTAWGLAVPSRIFDGMLHGSFTFDFHQFISLLSVGFMLLHVLVLMADQYAPFSVAQILVPFLSDYRPLWVGIGVLSLYMILLVTITFYLRNRIGMKAFRSIHVLSLLGFAGAALHGLLSGTDSPLPAVQMMYFGTFLSVVFLTTYWLVGQMTKRKRPTSPLPTRAR